MRGTKAKRSENNPFDDRQAWDVALGWRVEMRAISLLPRIDRG